MTLLAKLGMTHISRGANRAANTMAQLASGLKLPNQSREQTFTALIYFFVLGQMVYCCDV